MPRARPRQQHHVRAPCQAAAARRGQRAGRQLSQAALAFRLTSTRRASPGKSQRGCSLISTFSRQIVIGVHKWLKPRRNSLAGEKRHQGPEPGSQTSPETDSQRSHLSPAPCQGTWTLFGGGCSWAPSSPSLFQSALLSLSDRALLPTSTGTVWGTLGTGHKCQGQRGETVSPGQQAHCIVVGVGTEQGVPDTLALQSQQLLVTPQSAKQSLHGLHCKSVCTAKPRSHWERWLWAQGHGKDRTSGTCLA